MTGYESMYIKLQSDVNNESSLEKIEDLVKTKTESQNISSVDDLHSELETMPSFIYF